MLATETINNHINGFRDKWPWVFLFIVLLFGAIYFYWWEYRTRKLNSKLAALQILKVEKDLGLTNSKKVIEDALDGDIVQDAVKKIPFVGQL